MVDSKISLNVVCDVENIVKGPGWIEVRDDTSRLTSVVIASPGIKCREWVGGRTEHEIQGIIYTQPRDPGILTDDLVLRGKKRGGDLMVYRWAGWWNRMQGPPI